MKDRHFLFLQGLVGPSFRLLGRYLRRKGHTVSRINFTGGDMCDWQIGQATSYRGIEDGFGSWLNEYLTDKNVTDIILFGDCRPLHKIAIGIARERDIALHIFEEGSLRPNHVSLEHSGSNAASDLPRDMDGLKYIARQASTESTIPITSSFMRRFFDSTLYHVTTTIAAPYFWNYKRYRPHHAGREMFAWIARYLRRNSEEKSSNATIKTLARQRYFLFPMQIDGDFQLRDHSDFTGMEDALDFVFSDFAKHAPNDTKLLIKMHPFDPNIRGWRDVINGKLNALQLSSRISFIEKGNLDDILQHASGVVTINSTVGPLAMAANVPVKTLGRAIYDIKGVTANIALADFWQTPPTVNQENYSIFVDALRHHGLINGGFHDKNALKLLVQNAAQKMLTYNISGNGINGKI